MKPVLHEVDVGNDQRSGLTSSYVLTRVRAVVGALDLDCHCRSMLDAALGRFETLEIRRQIRAAILDARLQAERIAALLELVGELDTVTTDETDLSVFEEIALLFEDIKVAASRGAEDMIKAGSPEFWKQGSS